MPANSRSNGRHLRKPAEAAEAAQDSRRASDPPMRITLIGLGYLGLGDAAKAKAELAQAVEISPDLLGARTALAGLK